METISNAQKLENKLQEKHHQLTEVENDLTIQRKNQGDLGPLYAMRIEVRQEIRQLEQKLREAKQANEPPKIQYDTHSVLSTFLVRRRNGPVDYKEKLEEKTSQGERNKRRVKKISQAPASKKS